MKLILKLLITALLVVGLSKLLPGVSVDGYVTALIVALVLGLLNLLAKPILIILTLPITIITLGLFLLVINGFMILLCSKLIGGFSVASIWWAILFSLLLSIGQSILYSLLKKDEKTN